MSDFMLLGLSFVFSTLNIFVSIKGLIKGIGQRSVIVLFWLSVIYIANVPLLLDSFFYLIGLGPHWKLILNRNEINYVFQFNEIILYRTTFFVFAFNLIVYFVYEKTITITKINFICRRDVFRGNIPELAILICGLFGWLGLIYYYYFGFQAVYSSLLAVASAGIYYSLLRKKYVFALACSLPSILLAFLLTQRPYLVPVLSCFLMYILQKYKKVRLMEGLKIIFIGLFIVFLFTSVRFGRGHLSYLDILLSTAYPIVRDPATSTMYYAFEVGPALEEYGEYFAIKFLLGTGWFPATFFGEREFVSADLPHILAASRFSWDYGTIHPSIYGWSFVDMGWFGLSFAAFLGLLIGFCQVWSKGSIIREGVIYSTMSIFLLVAVRGSVQVGYSRMFYSLVLGVIFAWFIEFGQDRSTNNMFN